MRAVTASRAPKKGKVLLQKRIISNRKTALRAKKMN